MSWSIRRPRYSWRGRCIGCLAGLLVLAPGVSGAQPSDRLAFVGVALDATTRQADRRLMDYLREKVGLALEPEELEYERAIQRLVDWQPADGNFVARTTPYAYVVSELLGAHVEPLATYRSAATGNTIYHAYFVVNRKEFGGQPTLPDVLRFLRERKAPARFVFQNQFSASSYFLPSLFFRSNLIFQMPESIGPLVAIAAERIPEASSSRLVEEVARGSADVAAVWDGVKARFESKDPAAAATGSRVYFVELPTPLPNDLLVCSSGLDPQIKKRLREAIGAMRPDEIAVGDFRTWLPVGSATDTRFALGDLRQAARAGAAPVTVDIRPENGAAGAAIGMLMEAVGNAVRLSETEFVRFDEDFHQHVDFRWTIEPAHDGAAVLRSTIPSSDVPVQTFQVSFRSPDDLTARIVSIIHSRMHRIRYVWPFGAGAPIVIRNGAFSFAAGTPVKVQRITWLDPARNAFRAGRMFTARIENTNFYRYQLFQDDFALGAGSDAKLDPMSNAGFRVILVRPADEPLLFRALTIVLVALFVLAGAAAAWSLVVERTPSPAGSSAPGART